MFKGKKIFILAPHTDDGELGCGGAIARMIEDGAIVYYIAFSTADKSVPSEFPPNQLEIEVRNATKVLGILPEHLFVFNYEVRKLNYVRQEILESLILLRKKINPDIIYIPSPRDIHQDHSTVANEAIRAFKTKTIYGYELIWNNIDFKTNAFIVLQERHVAKKIEALNAYQTQSGKDYLNPDFIRSLAVVRGTQIGKPFAEAFELIRTIIE
ncbi:PIG-L family deacetylase [Candidatus Dojkabacteria bacterium]|jgi:LmbE family N-acetylglucosaminyl deacetylase|nr:PIG-L deacetylase family protein [Candidatus Brachybacter algidus]MBL0120003.1 PIG-L family deacetylase [Candidatus Brachybacter algidus]MBP9758303.1 PIG-L family deacetylase [Candidatus Dojkabacteria bacterium]